MWKRFEATFLLLGGVGLMGTGSGGALRRAGSAGLISPTGLPPGTSTTA